MEITNKAPSAKEYIALREVTGMGIKMIQKSEVALKNSLFVVSLWENGDLIGLGRIVGDGGVVFVVSDIMVHPKCQGKGYGKVIMTEIDKYFKLNCDERAYICLIADKPANRLYEKFGFKDVEPTSVGMKKDLTDFFEE